MLLVLYFVSSVLFTKTMSDKVADDWIRTWVLCDGIDCSTNFATTND